ncbi:MAG TPA: WecB/TagA/CpsF family glycosyltransferase [Actinomycetota bacterium]|jgi:exopolysaccharide biosynthesis WecB/TagA/CpsF family protein
MSAANPVVEILGVPIARLDVATALDEVERLYEMPGPQIVAYANAHTLNLAYGDPSYRELLRDAGIVLGDGAGVMLAARVNRAPLPVNLNGSDFNPRILERAADRGWPVYLLGAADGVAERAAERWTRALPGLDVVGTRHGFTPRASWGELAASVKATGAGLVMVAMGNPLQERWLEEQLPASGARLGVGVGAFFDFSTGQVPRAPAWMNRAGIEWVYRLYQEPRRMWRRYVLGNPLFLARVAKERLSRSR